MKEYFGNEIFVKNKLGNSRGNQHFNDCLAIFIEKDFFSDKTEMKIASLVLIRAAPTIDF
jgi:hypothetical protein